MSIFLGDLHEVFTLLFPPLFIPAFLRFLPGLTDFHETFSLKVQKNSGRRHAGAFLKEFSYEKAVIYVVSFLSFYFPLQSAFTVIASGVFPVSSQLRSSGCEVPA